MRHPFGCTGALVALSLCAAACRDPEAAPVAPRTEPPRVDRVGPLVRAADEAFQASLRPDYHQPFADRAIDRAPVRERYLEACRAGDPRSCWMAGAIGDIEPHDPVAESFVRESCRRGDRMSCRAIRDPESPDNLPGHAGRSCRHTSECKADAAILRRECSDGFPFSCILVHATHRPYDGELEDEMTARAMTLAQDGCDRGMIGECKVLLGDRKRASKIRAERRLCELVIEHCAMLADLTEVGIVASRDDDPIAARDAYERLCQYSAVQDRLARCQPVIERYRSGEFTEPVPGRREALELWDAEASKPQVVDRHR